MASPRSLEDKTDNSGCPGCIIYPTLIIPFVLSVWSCGYILGKYSSTPELPNKGVINIEEPKKPYESGKEKVEEQAK
jgi:hypothetical protein